jgi:hypothetical protein
MVSVVCRFWDRQTKACSVANRAYSLASWVVSSYGETGLHAETLCCFLAVSQVNNFGFIHELQKTNLFLKSITLA